MRGLSDTFMNDLKGGLLRPFLDLVREDDSLCLEIREEAINIYFRGGSMIGISRKSTGYEAYFDHRYLSPGNTRVPKLLVRLNGGAEVEAWINAVPHLKHEMGLAITRNHKYEREAQQLLVRENNLSALAGQTDYYICDIEYASPNGRFDLIAVHWPSTSQDRMNADELDLAFIEMKYGDGALAETAGLRAHVRDVARHATSENLRALKEEMRTVFNQKYDLGLVQVKKPIRSFSDRKPALILGLANHDPGSKRLENELAGLEIPRDFPVEVKVAAASLLGYGLFEGNVVGLEEFRERFAGRI